MNESTTNGRNGKPEQPTPAAWRLRLGACALCGTSIGAGLPNHDVSMTVAVVAVAAAGAALALWLRDKAAGEVVSATCIPGVLTVIVTTQTPGITVISPDMGAGLTVLGATGLITAVYLDARRKGSGKTPAAGRSNKPTGHAP